MSWVAAGVVGGALITGFMGQESSEDAAHATTQAAEQSAGVQREMYQTTRADLAPYRDVGAPALQRLMYLAGLGGTGTDGQAGSLLKPFSFSNADFEKSPGYEFRKAEGEKAIQRGALARGLDASSATLKNLSRFNQGLASDEFGAAFQRAFSTDAANKQQPFNVLSYLAGTGQNAAAMTGQAGTNMAAGTAQAYTAAGAGQAAAAMSSGAAWNNAIQGGISNYMYQKRYDDMMSRFPVFAGGTPTSNFSYTGTTAAGGYQYG